MVHQKTARISAISGFLLALTASYASLRGILDKELYTEVAEAGTISSFLVTGSVAQDWIILPTALALAILSLLFVFRPGVKKLILNLGLVSFLFYGYGLYVLQGQYTSIYILYLTIFGLSVWCMIYGLISFDWKAAQISRLSKSLRISLAVFLLLIPLVLVPVWLILILSDIAARTPADTYIVFVLDLCIVFPFLLIVVWFLFRNHPAGNILGGVAILKAFTVCLSVAFGEWYQSFAGELPLNKEMLSIFLPLSLISLLLVVMYFREFTVKV